MVIPASSSQQPHPLPPVRIDTQTILGLLAVYFGDILIHLTDTTQGDLAHRSGPRFLFKPLTSSSIIHPHPIPPRVRKRLEVLCNVSFKKFDWEPRCNGASVLPANLPVGPRFTVHPPLVTIDQLFQMTPTRLQTHVRSSLNSQVHGVVPTQANGLLHG